MYLNFTVEDGQLVWKTLNSVFLLWRWLSAVALEEQLQRNLKKDKLCTNHTEDVTPSCSHVSVTLFIFPYRVPSLQEWYTKYKWFFF